ncbi:MAG: hypothetical protein ACOYVF_13380 [Candidatus Zixiibacteriota bacterium]
MPGYFRKISSYILIASVMCVSVAVAGARIQLVGNNIPKNLTVGSRYIFAGSDTLYLNDRLLTCEVDYRFLSGYGYFDLSALNFSANDTLTVVYTPLPIWLQKTYGRALEPLAASASRAVKLPETIEAVERMQRSQIDISGAKSFRFSARSAGASEFSQSLDLNIAGELSPGLEISGSISDRGYDPAYGTANSRLNEIEKINIRLNSRRLTAQVGDIRVKAVSSDIVEKNVSGASFTLSYPAWGVRGMVARPKGLFRTYKFYGQDGFQGPYQIGEGSSISPVVPGSETVWLDGSQLERGANKDYTVDYVTGRITFNVTRLIDSRSRLEVDYEPQATDYKGELYAASAGTKMKDSLFFLTVDILREGDDKNQPLTGALSESDKNLLNAGGDSSVYRSGVTADTSGSFILVADSLPDSIYRFVGEGNGEYDATFSYVGDNAGGYRFLGNGNYEYVGDGAGDYRPVVLVPAPVRTDYFQLTTGSRSALLGTLSADIRTTSHDKNLFSSRDDGDNTAWYYALGAARDWFWRDRINRVELNRRVVEADYKVRQRLNRADFSRDFLLPVNYVVHDDETLNEINGTVSPLRQFTLTSFYSNLEYGSSFSARTGGVSAELYPLEKLTLSGGWRGIASDYEESPGSGQGSADNVQTTLDYLFDERLRLKTGFEYDDRVNVYTAQKRGTRYNRAWLELAGNGVNVRYEYYNEDTLMQAWTETLERNRVTSAFNHQLGDLDYDLTLSYQWLNQPQVEETNFLGRMNLRYYRPQNKLRLASSYTISEELRNERGLTYLEVGEGLGNYILEDGEYISDPDGNYIQVEEILSDNARVRRGQKTFDVSKDWRVVMVRFNSEIEEELLDSGRRAVWWALPFYSDENEPYLYFDRRYDVDLRAVPLGGFHAINIHLYEKTEIRFISGASRKLRDTQIELAFKQKLHESYFVEALELFKTARDSYYSGAGNIKGYKINLTYRLQTAFGELSAGGSYRRADSDEDERSRIISLLTGSRLKIATRGEIRTEHELYRQEFDNLTGSPSYKLTGNKPGEKGAEWKLSFNYGVSGGLRINLSVSGRHADNRTARITGRGEVVAGF